MCFNREEIDSSSVLPPLPQRKPATTVNATDGSIIDKIFNAGANVFDRIATIELERFEAERLLDIREAEEQARIARQRQLAGEDQQTFTTQQQIVGSTGLIAILMLGTAAVLIARR